MIKWLKIFWYVVKIIVPSILKGIEDGKLEVLDAKQRVEFERANRGEEIPLDKLVRKAVK